MGHANAIYDTEDVYKSTSIADSRLKKKSNSICYYNIHEAAAPDIQMIFKEGTETNFGHTYQVPYTRKALLSEK